eukprot:6724088-Alexandrium_andersonii.AAC.1
MTDPCSLAVRPGRNFFWESGPRGWLQRSCLEPMDASDAKSSSLDALGIKLGGDGEGALDPFDFDLGGPADSDD